MAENSVYVILPNYGFRRDVKIVRSRRDKQIGIELKETRGSVAGECITTYIHSVVPNSIGDLAGIYVGDCIMSINKIDVSTWKVMNVIELIEKSFTRVENKYVKRQSAEELFEIRITLWYVRGDLLAEKYRLNKKLNRKVSELDAVVKKEALLREKLSAYDSSQSIQSTMGPIDQERYRNSVKRFISMNQSIARNSLLRNETTVLEFEGSFDDIHSHLLVSNMKSLEDESFSCTSLEQGQDFLNRRTDSYISAQDNPVYEPPKWKSQENISKVRKKPTKTLSLRNINSDCKIPGRLTYV